MDTAPDAPTTARPTPAQDPGQAPAPKPVAFAWYAADHALTVLGRVWSADRHVAVRDVAPAENATRHERVPHMERVVAAAETQPIASVERENGYAIIDGKHVFAAHLLDLAEAATSGLAWHLSPAEPCPNLVGRSHGEPVALVMGMVGDASWVKTAPPGYPKCLSCGGDGRAEDCGKCEGSGEVECFHCGHETNCESCHGLGRIGKCAACGGSGNFVTSATVSS